MPAELEGSDSVWTAELSRRPRASLLPSLWFSPLPPFANPLFHLCSPHLLLNHLGESIYGCLPRSTRKPEPPGHVPKQNTLRIQVIPTQVRGEAKNKVHFSQPHKGGTEVSLPPSAVHPTQSIAKCLVFLEITAEFSLWVTTQEYRDPSNNS